MPVPHRLYYFRGISAQTVGIYNDKSIFNSCGDGQTRTAVFYRSSPFNKTLILNVLSSFEHNAIYLYISNSVCKFVGNNIHVYTTCHSFAYAWSNIVDY